MGYYRGVWLLAALLSRYKNKHIFPCSLDFDNSFFLLVYPDIIHLGNILFLSPLKWCSHGYMYKAFVPCYHCKDLGGSWWLPHMMKFIIWITLIEMFNNYVSYDQNAQCFEISDLQGLTFLL